MTRFLLFLLVIAGGRYTVKAQGVGDSAIARSVDSLLSANFKPNEPGAVVLIGKKGEVIFQKAFGSADLELGVPLQPDMLFKIGSVTKQFTAIGILQLAEKGLLSLQDSIQQFLPDFPHKGATITIENLLTHTSGIPDYADADTTHNMFIEREDFTPKDITSYFDYMPLQFKPGSRYAYSNSGYVLLGRIIEKVSGESYHQYITKNLLERAGLTHTLFADEQTILHNRVKGYTRDPGYYQNAEYQSISLAFAAGDLWATAGDLFEWNKALLQGRLVQKSTLQKAYTPYTPSEGKSSYGYGWFIDTLYGSRCIHHEGQISGFIAEEKYFPAEDIYVVILTNLKSGEDKTDFSNKRFRLFEKIAELALGRKLDKEILLSEEVLNTYCGNYEADFKVKGKRTIITIYNENGSLYADLSNGTGKHMILTALTDTKFLLPDVKQTRTSFEFVKENGRVTGLIATQEKSYSFRKME